MITKERLQELISQGATIWSDNWCELIELGANCEIRHIDPYYYLTVHEDEEHSPNYMIDFLEEDWQTFKRKHEHVEKYYDIRVERFEPPMWEELNIDEFIATCKSKSTAYCVKAPIQFISPDFDIYSIDLCYIENHFSIEVSTPSEFIKRFDFSEEGYYQALDAALKIFKGQGL